MKDLSKIIIKYKNVFISMLLIIAVAFVIVRVIFPQIEVMKAKNIEIEKETKKGELKKLRFPPIPVKKLARIHK